MRWGQALGAASCSPSLSALCSLEGDALDPGSGAGAINEHQMSFACSCDEYLTTSAQVDMIDRRSSAPVLASSTNLGRDHVKVLVGVPTKALHQRLGPAGRFGQHPVMLDQVAGG